MLKCAFQFVAIHTSDHQPQTAPNSSLSHINLEFVLQAFLFINIHTQASYTALNFILYYSLGRKVTGHKIVSYNFLELVSVNGLWEQS